MDTAHLRAHLAETQKSRRGNDIAVKPVTTRLPTSAELDDAEAYADQLSKSILLPAHYRRQPANILWAVEFGNMLGIPPMAAITGVAVIEGKPSASAALMGLLVRRAGHKLRVRGGKSWKAPAWAEIIRQDDPDFNFRAEWDVARAVDSRLVRIVEGKPYARDTKHGRPLPWERYTPALLKARSITEVARDACQDALFGLLYTPEELGAEVDAHGQPTGRLLEVSGEAAYHLDQAPTTEEALDLARQAHTASSDLPAEPERERIVIEHDAAAIHTPPADDDVLDNRDIDWSEALAAASAAGPQALSELWFVAKRAEPQNIELAQQINAAIHAAAGTSPAPAQDQGPAVADQQASEH